MKMNLFEMAFKNCIVMGLCPNQPKINRRMLVASFFLWLGSTFSTTFLLYEANTLEDFAQNLYVTAALILVSICFMQSVFQMPTLVRLVDDFDQTINGSK